MEEVYWGSAKEGYEVRGGMGTIGREGAMTRGKKKGNKSGESRLFEKQK